MQLLPDRATFEFSGSQILHMQLANVGCFLVSRDQTLLSRRGVIIVLLV